MLSGKIDPSFVVTHPERLEDAPAMYKKNRDKEDGVIKVVLRRAFSFRMFPSGPTGQIELIA